RRISHDMMPATLSSFGLEDAIEDLVSDLLPSTIHFEFNYSTDEEIENEKLKNHLYRITQEIVTNALKHSKPSMMTLEIKETKGVLSYKYTDDSDGFQFDSNVAEDGIGLKGILTRIQLLNGSIVELPTGTSVYHFTIQNHR
ncbi:MAG: hypothetical protein AAFQ02_12815, partial [Bacteroidota bacterium]